MTSRFGAPDAKKLFNGREVWEYRTVRMSQAGTETLIIYLEFEGGNVVSSVGN